MNFAIIEIIAKFRNIIFKKMLSVGIFSLLN
jgi:hypothetical protein